MDKRSEFSAALKESLKKQDKIATSTIRLILAALKDRDITEREHGGAEGVSESEILMMLQSMIKQRHESSKIYNEAGRDDLAEREEAEIEAIRGFLPKQITDEELSSLIDDLIKAHSAVCIKDMGKVMAVLKDQYAGQIDMGKAGAVAKAKLS